MENHFEFVLEPKDQEPDEAFTIYKDGSSDLPELKIEVKVEEIKEEPIEENDSQIEEIPKKTLVESHENLNESPIVCKLTANINLEMRFQQRQKTYSLRIQKAKNGEPAVFDQHNFEQIIEALSPELANIAKNYCLICGDLMNCGFHSHLATCHQFHEVFGCKICRSGQHFYFSSFEGLLMHCAKQHSFATPTLSFFAQSDALCWAPFMMYPLRRKKRNGEQLSLQNGCPKKMHKKMLDLDSETESETETQKDEFKEEPLDFEIGPFTFNSGQIEAYELEIEVKVEEIVQQSIPELDQHINKFFQKIGIHPYIKKSDCPFCPFKHSVRLYSHLEQIHLPRHPPTVLSKNGRYFKCYLCSQRSESLDSLLLHTQLCFRTHQITCPISPACKPAKFIKHLYWFHPQIFSKTFYLHLDKIMMYNCPLCDTKFITYESLCRHVNQYHLTEGLFDCWKCAKPFFVLELLVLHVIHCSGPKLMMETPNNQADVESILAVGEDTDLGKIPVFRIEKPSPTDTGKETEHPPEEALPSPEEPQPAPPMKPQKPLPSHKGPKTFIICHLCKAVTSDLVSHLTSDHSDNLPPRILADLNNQMRLSIYECLFCSAKHRQKVMYAVHLTLCVETLWKRGEHLLNSLQLTTIESSYGNFLTLLPTHVRDKALSECIFCMEKFSQKSACFYSHLTTRHMVEEMFTCPHCTFGVDDLNLFTLHIVRSHASRCHKDLYMFILNRMVIKSVLPFC